MLKRHLNFKSLLAICFLLLLTAGTDLTGITSHSVSNNYRPLKFLNQSQIPKFDKVMRANASWYGIPFHGRLTANGEIYNMNSLTAAHKSLPFDTQVKVTNLINGESVIVRINDRGPYIRGRQIDLSYKAAKYLNMVGYGVAPVKLEIMTAKNKFVYRGHNALISPYL